MQKRLSEHHDGIKQKAVQLWSILGNPVFDVPLNPETGFSAEVVAAAKRGRRCTFETSWLGSDATKKAIRDHERSEKKNSLENEEVGRLREHPEELTGYQRIMRRLIARH